MKLEWKTLFRVCLCVFLLYLAVTYWPFIGNLLFGLLGAAMPLVIGCVLAYVINILMSFYERHYFPRSARPLARRSRRPVCMAAAFLTLALILFLVVRMVLPQFVSCIKLLINSVPGTIRDIAAWLEERGVLSDRLVESITNADWGARIEQVVDVLATGVGSVMDVAVSTVSTVFSGVVTALVALIFSVYLLSGKERLGRQIDRVLRRYMRERHYVRMKYILSVLNDSFHRYIVGQCTEAVILGALCALGMFILRLPYAAMTGAVVAVTALIPVAGAYIGAFVGAFMILTVSPVKALIFLIFLVILQQLEGNLIYPRVVGSSIGLPPIWVLSAVTLGGGVLGIAGMLLFVPLASAAYRLLREELDRAPARPKAPPAKG